MGSGFSTLGGQPRGRIARLNADGTVDPAFNPEANGSVVSMVVQGDGKVLVAGSFTGFGGQPQDRIARLHGDGTLDPGFVSLQVGATNRPLVVEINPPRVFALAIQADGKILVGGRFNLPGGQPRTNIGRLNLDGTLDMGFNPGANAEVYALTVQADGRILVGGNFTTLGGQPRNRIARLHADGTVDAEFDPDANGWVKSLAVQADGKVLVGGWFTLPGAHTPRGLTRLHNTAPATQSLTCDGTTVSWLRGGSGPEVWRTTFEHTTNNTTWTYLGAGMRIPGGWQLSGLNLPTAGTIRARGYVAGGLHNGSAWFVETLLGGPVRMSLRRDRSQVLLT